MSDAPISARFIESGARRIFVIARRPLTSSGGAVLVAAPFAEEMNKSRRMLSEVARGLAAHGIATVLPDLTGTGDSDGDFADADWEQWCADLLAAARWSAGEGWPVTALLGVRSGCILGAQAVRQLPQPLARTVFWQPLTDGERYLTQFLRLRVAASMMGGGADSAAGLRARLAGGEALEVAGYLLTPRLAAQLAALRLADVVGPGVGRLHWMEVVRSADGSGADLPHAAGVGVIAHRVVGEPFWSSTEIVTVPELISKTLTALVAG